MTKTQFKQFSRIFNALKTISTKGEDTLVMADCLRALQALSTEIVIEEDEDNDD